MSSIFDNIQNKKKCQIFTPSSMVDTMLDLGGYTTNLLGHRVLENSFGTGNILKAVVKRYIWALCGRKDKYYRCNGCIPCYCSAWKYQKLRRKNFTQSGIIFVGANSK